MSDLKTQINHDLSQVLDSYVGRKLDQQTKCDIANHLMAVLEKLNVPSEGWVVEVEADRVTLIPPESLVKRLLTEE
jgi:sulfur carrier protein ThiS